jgi:hypothetical protein
MTRALAESVVPFGATQARRSGAVVRDTAEVTPLQQLTNKDQQEKQNVRSSKPQPTT